MQVEPCPKCGKTDIKFTNCGYTTFDVATAECKCGHKIIVSICSDAQPAWNAFADSQKCRALYHWMLAEEGKLRRASPSEVVKVAARIFEKGEDVFNTNNYSI